jgi:hypothetical protein
LAATTIPVETATGKFVYWDMTILLNADSKGNLTLAPGYPKFQPSVPFNISGFEAGAYAGPATIASGKYFVTVTGPGVGPAGSTLWSLATAKGADACTVPVTAVWYTGPIAGNPLAPRLKKAGINSPDYSYGIVGAGSPCGGTFEDLFEQGALIGASQTGPTLSISSFTANGKDSNVPLGPIVYTLQR